MGNTKTAVDDGEIAALFGEFEVAWKTYEAARSAQRKLIAKALERAGYTVPAYWKRQGSSKYNSQGRLAAPFDLRNWKWLVAHKQLSDIWVVVSFQTLEQDSDTKNVHALIDCISVDVFKDPDGTIHGSKAKKDAYAQSIRDRYGVTYEFETAYLTKTVTRFTLPLTAQTLAELIAEITARVKQLPQ